MTICGREGEGIEDLTQETMHDGIMNQERMNWDATVG